MKPISQSDRALIDAIARLWVSSGGDETGIELLWDAIRDRVREMRDEILFQQRGNP